MLGAWTAATPLHPTATTPAVRSDAMKALSSRDRARYAVTTQASGLALFHHAQVNWWSSLSKVKTEWNESSSAWMLNAELSTLTFYLFPLCNAWPPFSYQAGAKIQSRILSRLPCRSESHPACHHCYSHLFMFALGKQYWHLKCVHSCCFLWL